MGWQGGCCNVPRQQCPKCGANGNVTCGGPNRGTCRDGSCHCERRWNGPCCDEPEEVCPDDYLCYHGRCNAFGHCDCDPGYTGDDCSLGPFYGPGHPDECDKAPASKACAARAAAARASLLQIT